MAFQSTPPAPNPLPPPVDTRGQQPPSLSAPARTHPRVKNAHPRPPSPLQPTRALAHPPLQPTRAIKPHPSPRPNRALPLTPPAPLQAPAATCSAQPRARSAPSTRNDCEETHGAGRGVVVAKFRRGTSRHPPNQCQSRHPPSRAIRRHLPSRASGGAALWRRSTWAAAPCLCGRAFATQH